MTEMYKSAFELSPRTCTDNNVIPVKLLLKTLSRLSRKLNHVNDNPGKISNRQSSCADLESFVRRFPALTTLFVFSYEGRQDPNTTIGGPSLAHQETPLKWRFASVPKMAQH